MKLSRTVIALSLGIMVTVGGCLGPSPSVTRPGRLYESPRAADEPTAALVGTTQPGPLWIWGPTAFPFAVDGIRVYDASSRWNIPVLLPQGTHVVTAEMSAHPFFARADLEITVESGHNYTLNFATDVFGRNGPTFCEFWIVNESTGAMVSSLVRVNVLKKNV